MYDFLIIGHGLAGAVLSQELLQRGKKVLVFDQPEMNKSSVIAAGLYNPVTGRKMVKTWLADELFQEIEPTYTRLEKWLGATFLNKIGIYRPFVDIAEQNDWEGKKSDPSFKRYVEALTRSAHPQFKLNDPFGGLHLAQSGFLDVHTLLHASKARLVSVEAYTEAHFDENELKVSSSGLSYKGHDFRQCIFCNGLGALQSHFFDWLPFTPVKGEILIGKTEKPIKKIYNRGVFMLPTEEGLVKVGSTYKNSFSHDEPTKEGELEILEKLTQLTSQPFKPIRKEAGIRPATKDRKPFIGKHPEYEHIYMFNGFGSKGVSLVPFFARQFIEYLEGNSSFNDDVDIRRYANLYNSVGLL